jgi:hypothetical protein
VAYIYLGEILLYVVPYIWLGVILFTYTYNLGHILPRGGGGVPIRSIAAHLKEFYVDDSFAGGWDKPDTSNSEAVMTRI